MITILGTFISFENVRKNREDIPNFRDEFQFNYTVVIKEHLLELSLPVMQCLYDKNDQKSNGHQITYKIDLRNFHG